MGEAKGGSMGRGKAAIRAGFVLLTALVLPACPHVCHAKSTNAGIYTGFSSHYKACKHECLEGSKECGCSAACPCWKAENHPKVQAPPPR